MLRTVTIRPFLQFRQTCAAYHYTTTPAAERVAVATTGGDCLSPLRILGRMRPLGITTVAIGTSLVMKKPVLCQPLYTTIPATPSFSTIFTDQKSGSLAGDDDVAVTKSLFHKGELSFGIVLGFCTGYLIKKVGKLFALVVGAGFMFLQYLSFQGFITVHWDRLEGRYKRHLDVDQDGRVTQRDVRTRWNSIVNILTHQIQFKSTFMIGLYTGIRYG